MGSSEGFLSSGFEHNKPQYGSTVLPKEVFRTLNTRTISHCIWNSGLLFCACICRYVLHSMVSRCL